MTFEEAIITAIELLPYHKPGAKPTARAVADFLPDLEPRHAWGWRKVQRCMNDMVARGLLEHVPPRDGYTYNGKTPVKSTRVHYCPLCGQPTQLALPLQFQN